MTISFQESLARGVELFNRQEFYEAHEAWEEGWIDELSDQRLLLQGLIQVAAGFHKLHQGSPTGTMKLLELGLKKLRMFLDAPLGVDLQALLPQVEWWRKQAERLAEAKRAEFDQAMLPKISYCAPVPRGGQ